MTVSKDHIKSDLPVTTDWWNEHVSEVYLNGCHIGRVLFARDNNTHLQHSNPIVLGKGNVVQDAKSWLAKVDQIRKLFDLQIRSARNNRQPPPDLDFGDAQKVVLLNQEGLMIYNKNEEIERQSLEEGCAVIRNIPSKLLTWIDKDEEMRNRFRTLLFSEMERETQFTTTFEFLIQQDQLVYGESMVEALNQCFLDFGTQVTAWNNVTWATLSVHLDNFSPTKTDKDKTRFNRTVYLPGNASDMSKPVNFTPYDFQNLSNKGPRRLTKCTLVIGRTYLDERNWRKKVSRRPSFTLEKP